MPTFYPSIPPDLATWALQQPLFFTASAPTYGSHINVSPKGYTSSSLTVLSPTRAAYLDATGSGAETISHVYENGRVTIMFNSFGSAPKIMRWFCRGRVVEVVDEGEKGWEEWREARGWFDGEITSGRAVIVLDVWKCQVSCGFGVPVSGLGGKGGEGEEEGEGKERGKGDVERLEAFSTRRTLADWGVKTARKDEGRGIQNYRVKNNCRSLDGLPGLRAARRDHGEILLLGDVGARARRMGMQWGAVLLGMLFAVWVAFMGIYLGVVEVRFHSIALEELLPSRVVNRWKVLS